MQNTTTQNQTNTSHVDHVVEAIQSSQAGLVELLDCLRREREYVTFFDVASLMQVLEEKSHVLERNATAAVEQREAITQCWRSLDPWDETMPENVFDVLERLADTLGGNDGARIAQASSELDALRSAAKELHDVNQGLLNRAVSWISSYVSELVDTTTVGTYDVTGRVAGGRTGSLLTRKVG